MKKLRLLIIFSLLLLISGCSTKKENIVYKNKYIGSQQKLAPETKDVTIYFLHPLKEFPNYDVVNSFVESQKELYIQRISDLKSTILFYSEQVKAHNAMVEKYANDTETKEDIK